MRKIIYLDMDGPLANFDAGIGHPYTYQSDPPEMFQKGFFRNLPVTPGAKKAVARLLANPNLDVNIATKPTVKEVLYSTIEKYEWIQAQFPPLLKKMYMVCNKGNLIGDVLVDDDKAAWEGKFKGLFVFFDRTKPEESWEKAIKTIETVCNIRWTDEMDEIEGWSIE